MSNAAKPMADPQSLFTLEQLIAGFNHLRAFQSDELAEIVYSQCDAASVAAGGCVRGSQSDRHHAHSLSSGKASPIGRRRRTKLGRFGARWRGLVWISIHRISMYLK